MTRILPLAALLITLFASSASAQTVRIAEKPDGLVRDILYVPIQATEPVQRLALFVNGVKLSEAQGRSATVQVNVGRYIRRLRLRAVGYDEAGTVVGEDEMVVNDPRPPFRVRLVGPRQRPETGQMLFSATVICPDELRLAGVDFYLGEQKIATVTQAPFTAAVDVTQQPDAVYARVVARAADGSEANDVLFLGEGPSDKVDVTVQQIPLSVSSAGSPLKLEDLALIDSGESRRLEALVPASDQPLSVVLLIDYSESMLEELPVVKAAARQFGRALLRPQDRIAVVGFNQRLFWLTPFTNDFNAAATAVDRVTPVGETHLYDSVIEVLYELQKQPGRRALVVLTDGMDQGSAFTLDHLAHYARYAGVPVYPIVKNKMLSRLMRFGVGRIQARRLSQLARDTGATYFIIQRESELPAVYSRIADELRQQYQLVFYSAPSATDQWHPLAISAAGGQQLRVPRGYFP